MVAGLPGARLVAASGGRWLWVNKPPSPNGEQFEPEPSTDPAARRPVVTVACALRRRAVGDIVDPSDHPAVKLTVTVVDGRVHLVVTSCIEPVVTS